jgi:hypothetical protein
MHGYSLWIFAFPASREFDARSGLPGCPVLQDMCTISIPVILASQERTCRFALMIAIGAECIQGYVQLGPRGSGSSVVQGLPSRGWERDVPETRSRL